MSFRFKEIVILFFVALFIPLQLIAAEMGQNTPDYTNEDKKVVVYLEALDKITTQLSTIVVAENQTVRFGTLEITLRHCRSNPPEESPENVAFLEITDIGHNNQSKKVFSGWMFSSSPALSPLEHPVYDVWVKYCKVVSGPESKAKE